MLENDECVPSTKVQRFWNAVKKTDTCWLWVGYKDYKGYGIIRISKNPSLLGKAHRFSYELHKGEIPKGLLVMHICHNRACVNPEHLKVGTNAENMKMSRGRNRLLNEEQIREVHETKGKVDSATLGHKFKVSRQLISDIRSGRVYKS